MDLEPNLFAFSLVLVRWQTIFALAGLIGGLLVARQWIRIVSPNARIAIPACLAIAVGMLAGRLAVAIERPDLLARGTGGFFLIAQGGFSLPAAAAGGGLITVLWALFRRVPIGSVLGAAAPALLIGEAIGSLGLLLAGEPAGLPFPFGLVYSRPDTAVPPTLLGRPVVPIALLSLVWSAITFVLIWAGWPIARASDRWRQAALAFGLGHLLVGYGRLDSVWILGLRQDQVIALAFVFLGAYGLIFRGSAAQTNKSYARIVSMDRGVR